jgi:hypothetical protein
MTTTETANGPKGASSSPGLRPSLVSVAAVGAIGVALTLALAGARSGFGVAAGSGLAVANLWAFGRLGSGLLSPTGAAPWITLALVKLVVLFAAVFFLLSLGVVGPVELALGYLAMPVGIALSYVVFPNRGLDRKRESA